MRFLALASLVLTVALGSVSAQIYADFETSLGNFTCELNYTAAPKTVANFVGLAEGSKVWIDPKTGSIKENTPFYDGLIFHRVIAGFMNQGGCPLGTGFGGPGYMFADETSNGLPHAPYVISMANSGPNTNGSQFFITASLPASGLNGKHTVFGSVISGMPVIDQINATATGKDDRPTTSVVIQHVGIRRVGAAEQAFDATTQKLPVVRRNLSAVLDFEKTSSEIKVSMAPQSSINGGSIVNVYRSTDLVSWTQINRNTYFGTGPAGSPSMILDYQEQGSALLPPKAFYRFAEVNYPTALGPSSMAGRTLTALLGANESFVFVFDTSGNGGSATYFHPGGNSVIPISSVNLSSEMYHSVVYIHTSSPFGSLAVQASWTGDKETNVIGSHRFHQYLQPEDPDLPPGWVQVGSGNVTLTK